MSEGESRIMIISIIIIIIATFLLVGMIVDLVEIYDYEREMEQIWGDDFWNLPYRQALLDSAYKDVIMGNIPCFILYFGAIGLLIYRRKILKKEKRNENK